MEMGVVNKIHLGLDCMDEDTIIHEIIHSLGVDHEHQRSDRDEHVEIQWDNIPEVMWSQFKIKSHYNPPWPYDCNSIMHYAWNETAMDPDKPTFLPRGHCTIRVDRATTPGDFEKINSLYGCNKPETVAAPAPVQTLWEPALKDLFYGATMVVIGLLTFCCTGSRKRRIRRYLNSRFRSQLRSEWRKTIHEIAEASFGGSDNSSDETDPFLSESTVTNDKPDAFFDYDLACEPDINDELFEKTLVKARERRRPLTFRPKVGGNNPVQATEARDAASSEPAVGLNDGLRKRFNALSSVGRDEDWRPYLNRRDLDYNITNIHRKIAEFARNWLENNTDYSPTNTLYADMVYLLSRCVKMVDKKTDSRSSTYPEMIEFLQRRLTPTVTERTRFNTTTKTFEYLDIHAYQYICMASVVMHGYHLDSAVEDGYQGLYGKMKAFVLQQSFATSGGGLDRDCRLYRMMLQHMLRHEDTTVRFQNETGTASCSSELENAETTRLQEDDFQPRPNRTRVEYLGSMIFVLCMAIWPRGGSVESLLPDLPLDQALPKSEQKSDAKHRVQIHF
ncbi:hypothetical protein RvY_11270 [Ramazzottius varieornatus]|uniref:Metalloendopeptidase n=1 Tax=Ramazzottius varieornatus TaxID=947166 RepID=A0A1D1VHM4_RAMVA|nr:hypothetical protein RvY_11270 [Ramazzottius varieornatus]